jgi:hypothetical protein
MDGGESSNGVTIIPPGTQGTGSYTFWRNTIGVISNMTLRLYADFEGITIAEQGIQGTITYEQTIVDHGNSFVNFTEFTVEGEPISLPVTLSTGDRVTAHFSYSNDSTVDAYVYVDMDGGESSNGVTIIPPGTQGSGTYTFWRHSPGVISNMTLKLYTDLGGVTLMAEPILGTITYNKKLRKLPFIPLLLLND